MTNKMLSHLFFVLLSICSTNQLYAQKKSTTEDSLIFVIQNMKKTIPCIELLCKNSANAWMGSGIVLGGRIKEKECYLVLTAFHVIDSIIANESYYAIVTGSNNFNINYKSQPLSKNHIVWFNRDIDAAIMVLPSKLMRADNKNDSLPAYSLNVLRNVSTTESILHRDAYFIGWRFIRNNYKMQVIKKGFVSLVYKDENNITQILVDNLANHGMSGGLIFTSKGIGIALICGFRREPAEVYSNKSNYVYPMECWVSEDLTYCYPMEYFDQKLTDLLKLNSDSIYNLIYK